MFILTPGSALAGNEESDSSRALEITRSRDQVPLLGEVKITNIPASIFLEKKKDIIDRGKLLTAGYITSELNPFGFITETELEKESVSFNDIITIDRGSNSEIKAGDTFFIYKKIKNVKDPKTKKRIGDLVSVTGALEVTVTKKSSSKGIIIKSYDMIEVGQMIIPEYKIVIPELDSDRPLADKSVSGKVIALNEARYGVSEGDVIYIDVGRSKGVEEGDIFEIIATMDPIYQRNKETTTNFKKVTGKAQVIVVREKTSTAVIVDSILEVSEGDTVNYIQERL
ncbi:MAG: hypothetical protein V3S46_04610 [Nitrospinota bacterium]